MSKEILPHEKLVRARLLPYNTWYRDEVIAVRTELSLPESGFTSIGDALRWWINHRENYEAGDFVCSECGERFTTRVVHCGKEVSMQWYQGNLDDPRKWEEYRRYTFWQFNPLQKRVPLYSKSLSICERYILPDWAFFVTVWYILTNQFIFPHLTGELLPYPPPYEHREHHYPKWGWDNKGRSYIEITIDEYTTKKEWEKLWPTVQTVRDELREQTGIKPSSMKRGVGKKGLEIINRWIEIYQLYNSEKNILKIASIWQDEHPDEPYSEDAIKKIIKEMEKMMRPK